MIRGKGDGLGVVYGGSGELLLKSERERFFGRRVLHVTLGAGRGPLGPKGETFRALVYLTNLRLVAISTLGDGEMERHVPPPTLVKRSGSREGPSRDYMELPRGQVEKLTKRRKAMVLTVRSEGRSEDVELRPMSVAVRLLTPMRTW